MPRVRGGLEAGPVHGPALEQAPAEDHPGAGNRGAPPPRPGTRGENARAPGGQRLGGAAEGPGAAAPVGLAQVAEAPLHQPGRAHLGHGAADGQATRRAGVALGREDRARGARAGSAPAENTNGRVSRASDHTGTAVFDTSAAV